LNEEREEEVVQSKGAKKNYTIAPYSKNACK
jgi:hypothetical protein